MDCHKAQDAVMQHIENRLAPDDARGLTLHILHCESCRALYLLMDASAELPVESAPAAFTEQVMARVQQVTVMTVSDVLLRALWVGGGILLGVLLLLTQNPEWAATVALFDAVATVQAWYTDATAWITQREVFSALGQSGLGVVALVLAGLIAGVLYGLHRGENVPERHAGA